MDMNKQFLIAAAASLAVMALAGPGAAQQTRRPRARGRTAPPPAPGRAGAERPDYPAEVRQGAGRLPERSRHLARHPLRRRPGRRPALARAQGPASWAGVKAATSYGGSCAAVEDCLYLNVYTPPNASKGDNCR
jgi:hypothetical protein